MASLPGPFSHRIACALGLSVLSVVPLPISAAEFRNFKLPCLAPLLRDLDSEAPASVDLAFLRGPSRAPQLHENIGTVELPLTTNSPDAAAYFNQGVAFIHGLSNAEAERSFRQALLHDPENPLIFWGLSLANEQRPHRARLFAQNAVRRVKNETSDRERKLIATVGAFYNLRRDGPAKLPPAESLTAAQIRERHRKRIRDLESIVLNFPDDIEARALLLRQLVLDKHRSGIPLTSHVAVEQLARSIAEVAPAHPSLHYRIFLWLDERPAFALPPAARSPSLAPGLADSWRYAGEAWRANGLHHHALPLLECALRVHHRHAANQLLVPDRIENLAANYETLIDSLLATGQIEEAVRWSRRLLSLPRSLNANGPSPAAAERIITVRGLLAGALLRAERFDDLLTEIENAQPAATSLRERALLHYWRGAALAFLHRDAEIAPVSHQLDELAKSPSSPAERAEIAALIAGLRDLRIVCRHQKVKDAAPLPPRLPLNILARAWFMAGDHQRALDLARQDHLARTGDLFATATWCELNFEAGQQVAAMSAFNRRFREDALRADKKLPALARLAPLAAKMQLPKRWQLPAKPLDIPALPKDPNTLGPLEWTPPQAPAFSLPDHTGRPVSLAHYKGKAVLLNFFLGVSCPYCVTQLNRFRPHLDAFAKTGVSLVAISTDSTGILKKRFGNSPEKSPETRSLFPYPVLADPKLATFKSYRVFDDFENGPMHATFLLDPAGRILWSDVSHEPFNHPEALLAEARRLLAASAALPARP